MIGRRLGDCINPYYDPMSNVPFAAPTLTAMNSFLPAFEFTGVAEISGRGVVYFALQKSLDRQVAIKLFPHATNEDSGSRQSFEEVASAMARLKDPNLIGIFDSGSVEGIPYLVMEFVPGKSLARSTAGHSVDFRQAVTLMEDISSGLACAHAKGIPHGNLTLSNILLNQKAEPKVGNFGFKRLNRGEPSPYDAPELRDGAASATPRSDVFSLGAIFRELLTGRPPGPDASPLPALPLCGEQISAFIKQAMAPDPSQRMADAGEFLAALTDAVSVGKPKLSRSKQAGPSVAPSPAKKKVMVTKVGFDKSLLVKGVIIVALLFGINFAWNNLKSTRAKRDSENMEILAQNEERKKNPTIHVAPVVPSRPVDETREVFVPKRDTPVAEAAPAERKESPEESLERLRTKLLSGKRSEMPIGTLHQGESDYFLVSERMTWSDAALFAEAHGAHLAIPGGDADAAWLADEVAKSGPAWIGVGQGGTGSWVTVAGAALDFNSAPSGTGQYLTVNKGGAVRAEADRTPFPFIIQWHADGSNPGTIASRLTAVGTARKQGKPIFPPGTVTLGERQFLYIPQAFDWKEASAMAESSGGHLMVISADEEAAFLRKLTAELNAPGGIWLGANLVGDQWRWITGETWKAADWRKDSGGGADGASLVMLPGKGWDSRDSQAAATGFIIEWSSDLETAPADRSEVSEAAELLAKAKEVVLAAEKKRSDELAENAKKFSWDLDAFIRGQNSAAQATWGPEVERLKLCVEDDRLQGDKAIAEGIRFSAEMAKIAEYAVGKQARIDKSFAETLTAIRDSFVGKMTGIHDVAVQSGQLKAAESANEAIAGAEDLGGWVGSFGVDAPN